MAAEHDTPKGLAKNARLPFEPKKRQKLAKETKPADVPAETEKKPPRTIKKLEKKTAIDQAAKKSEPPRRYTKEEMAVPKIVSDRMARRMALFCGVPSFLGVATFVVSYIMITKYGIKPPNIAVVLVSMGFFGLGVLGLTYGVLSASWDEERVGGFFGWQEFALNWKRMLDAWRASRQKNV